VIAPAGSIDTTVDRVTTRLTGNFDAAHEVKQVVVGRVATGMETTDRQSLGELIRNIGAGEDPGGSRPTSQAVPVYLNDLGMNVFRDYQDPSPGLVRLSTRDYSAEAIILAFYLKPGQNISEMGTAIDEILATANDTFLPKDIRIAKVSNKPEIVDKKIAEVVENLVDSVLIVLGVLILMSGFRVATVCALAIPMIMLIAVGFGTVRSSRFHSPP
jgi:multidrug efflux pump subunit AcrB